ncbi:hypothetical protein IVA96_07265 [Bradyrhizobium sp. 159]|uniref:hypothetical protein n=1 Tax=Bradyrhizobium sp. 159 TaxID=2782632 RepID=UPI001FFA21D4|nr:hypothetical protein [Bradyrhizobium sp. 159]MCK1616455.1 hypothetical protein [Bradyrhizobium sp. 159]
MTEDLLVVPSLVRNFVEKAVKYTPNGGRMDLRLYREARCGRSDDQSQGTAGTTGEYSSRLVGNAGRPPWAGTAA